MNRTSMKVALVSTGLGNVRRGFEVFFQTLFEKLSGKIDVTLLKGGGVAEGPHENVLPNLSRDSGLWKALGMHEKNFWKRYRVEQLSFLVPLLLSARKHRFDILHVSEYHLGRYLKILGNRLLPDAPSVVLHNGHPLLPAQYTIFDQVQHLTEYFYLQGIDAGVPPDRMSMVPIGVDEKVFAPRKTSSFRQRMNIPEDVLLILSVGALERRKRLHWLIEEAAALRKELFLLIVGEVGEGDEVREIRSLAEERMKGRVKFACLQHAEMLEAYSAADLCVSCALYEGFGISLIESMSMEVPVFCHHHPSLRWIVGRGGESMDMEKRGELQARIRYFLDHRAQLGETGRQGRKRILEQFSWDVLVPRYIEMYQKTCCLR